MRSYKQYCGLAKALDVIGDRWTLLIVRELLIRERCRYTDLLKGLPGIATNLLVDRLRDLEQAGVIARTAEPPPIATDLFSLTARGRELEGPILELGRWGAPLLASAPREDQFCGHWLALPAKLHLVDRDPRASPVSIEIRTDDEPLTIVVGAGAVTARPGPGTDPDVTLSGSPRVVLDLLVGRTGLPAALAKGLKHEGNLGVLKRIQPDKTPPKPPHPRTGADR